MPLGKQDKQKLDFMQTMAADLSAKAEFTITLPGRFGRLLVCYCEGRLSSVRLATGARGGVRKRDTKVSCPRRDPGLETRLSEDFLAYFSGKKVTFDYPSDVDDFTPFEKAVWASMRKIPYGETRSYGWIAESIGRPRACRAVGNACGKNPLLIIQPCHRVVGSHGKLGGFSAGLELKKALLRLEGIAVY